MNQFGLFLRDLFDNRPIWMRFNYLAGGAILVILLSIAALGLMLGGGFVVYFLMGGRMEGSTLLAILVAVGMFVLVPVGAIAMRVFWGVKTTRVRGSFFIGSVFVLAISYKLVAAIPTTGSVWNSVLWAGFGLLAVAIFLTALVGNYRWVRWLFAVAASLLLIGALSVPVSKGVEKISSLNFGSATAPPQECRYYLLDVDSGYAKGEIFEPAYLESGGGLWGRFKIVSKYGTSGVLEWNGKIGTYRHRNPHETTYAVTLDTIEPRLKVWTGMIGKKGQAANEVSCTNSDCWRFRITCNPR